MAVNMEFKDFIDQNLIEEGKEWEIGSPWESVKNKVGENWREWDRKGGKIDRVMSTVEEITDDPLTQTLTFHLVGHKVSELIGDGGEIDQRYLEKIVYQERIQAEAPFILLESYGESIKDNTCVETLLKETNEYITPLKYSVFNRDSMHNALWQIEKEREATGHKSQREVLNKQALTALVFVALICSSSTSSKASGPYDKELQEQQPIRIVDPSLYENISPREITSEVFSQGDSESYVARKSLGSTRERISENEAEAISELEEERVQPIDNEETLRINVSETIASAKFDVPVEGIEDAGIIYNMEMAKNLINKYFENNHMAPLSFPEGSSLQSFVRDIYNNPSSYSNGIFRYLQATSFFDNSEDLWVYPRRGGIEGAGACDIATLIKRTITSKFEQIGVTESFRGHSIERRGPFVIVYMNHTPYPRMAPDMIAVSSLGQKYSDFMNITNSEFIVFLLDDGTFSEDAKLGFRIEEEDQVFTADLIIQSGEGDE